MNKNEKYIKEVIKRYGHVINLKQTPYLLIEIVRNFGPVFEGDEPEPPDGGLPCGGVPQPPPPPGPEGRGIRRLDLVEQIAELTAVIAQLNAKVDGLLAQGATTKAVSKTRRAARK